MAEVEELAPGRARLAPFQWLHHPLTQTRQNGIPIATCGFSGKEVWTVIPGLLTRSPGVCRPRAAKEAV
jgi:hypothetical protein